MDDSPSRQPAGAPRPGGQFMLGDRYVAEQLIAHGGAATVYAGHDDVLDRRVAIKLLRVEGGPAPREDFLREARAAAALDHPHIVKVFDAGAQDSVAYLVMEYVPGETLREVIARSAPLDPTASAMLAAEIADALDYAHRRGVVHCDIKPGNVLLPALDTPKIVDFGIARAGTAAPDGDSIAGTAGYIAPEQLAGHTPDGRADVFALGAVLYEMIVGAPAFPSRSLAAAARRADEPPLPPHQRNAAVPPGLGAVVMRALAPSPTDRFQTAAAFAAALRQTAAEGATREAPRRVAPPRSSEQATQVAPAPLPVATRRTPWVALVLVGVVAVAAAGAGAFVALGALGFGQAKTAAPNVVGRPINDAADQIHAAGLEVATPVVFRRATQPFGAVIEQQPRAGTSLSEGAVVQLVVSCGEARAAECE